MPAHLSPEQLERALELQRKCWTQDRIAAELGVHRTTVTRSLGKHNRRVLERLLARSAAIKAQQIGQLEWMADESVQAWEKSKLDAETVKTTEEGPAVTGDAGGPVVVETTTETTVKGQTGTPAHLAEARAALADIRKILGLDATHELAAEKLALQTKDDDTPSVRDALSEAESRDEAFGESDDLEPEGEGQGDTNPEAPADSEAPGPVPE